MELFGGSLLEKLSADVWFVFGSFVYGLEGSVSACSPDGVEIHLQSAAHEDAQGLSQFLEEVVINSRRLLKTQICFYDTGSVGSSSEDLCISLFTEVCPAFCAGEPSGHLVLSGLRGVTDDDFQMWQKLVAGTWPFPLFSR